jgi:hypothetical protein
VALRTCTGEDIVVATTPDAAPGTPHLDFDEVARLVTAIEHDLAGVQAGRGNLEALREEVRALGALLEASPGQREMGHGLERVHRLLDGVAEVAVEDGFKAADYLARIGRMLAL